MPFEKILNGIAEGFLQLNITEVFYLWHFKLRIMMRLTLPLKFTMINFGKCGYRVQKYPARSISAWTLASAAL
jgi:hypothetical protein